MPQAEVESCPSLPGRALCYLISSPQHPRLLQVRPTLCPEGHDTHPLCPAPRPGAARLRGPACSSGRCGAPGIVFPSRHGLMGGSAFLPGHVRWPAAGALFPFGFQDDFQRRGGNSGMWEAVTCVEVVRAFEGLVHESLLLRLPASAGPSVCTRGRVELRPSGENVSLNTECVCTGECVCRSCT